jgi:restriction endonuclease S subunit
MTQEAKSVSLLEVVDLQDGYPLRRPVMHEGNGTVNVIESGDLTKGTGVDVLLGTRSNLIEPDAKYVIHTGDVLVSTGHKHRANVVRALPQDLVTICTSTIWRLRPKIDEVASEYLVVFLNLPATRQKIDREVQGTGWNRETLGALEIVIPSTERQNAVCQLACALTEEQQVSE